MTIAIGISCPSGSVLLSDSMSIRVNPDGESEGILTAEAKIGFLPRSGLGYVWSGHGPNGTAADLAPKKDFATTARALFASVGEVPALSPELQAAFSGRMGEAPDRRELRRLATQEMVIAGPGWQPLGQLACLTSDGERWAGAEGAVYICRAPSVWAMENGYTSLHPPDRLEDCVDLAVSIAEKFIAHHYNGRTFEDHVAARIIPAVAGPLHILKISSSEVTLCQHHL